MKRKMYGITAAALVLCALTLAACGSGGGGTLPQVHKISRVSVDSSGAQAEGGKFGSYRPSISSDGRSMAFVSDATNLVAGDTNAVDDIFVRNLEADTTERASVASDGAEADARSAPPSISDDGRYVALFSYASNLVTGDSNGLGDVFVRDRQTDATTCVSVTTAGVAASGFSPSISGDGRYVAFQSYSTSIVSGDTNGTLDIFVHDRQSGTSVRVSIDSSGTEADDYSDSPSISGNGRYVAFTSNATNLVSGDSNGWKDIFVHDRDTDGDGVFDEAGAVKTVRVTVASDGTEADASSLAPSISADGRHVAFQSTATTLIPGDTSGTQHIFVHDRDADGDGIFDEAGTISTTRVSIDSSGAAADFGSNLASISSDGRSVAFRSSATNLVAGDTNARMDVFVHDRQTGVTKRVSTASDGTQADGASDYPSISGDGRSVAFQSSATNLVPGDTNGKQDIFLTILQ